MIEKNLTIAIAIAITAQLSLPCLAHAQAATTSRVDVRRLLDEGRMHQRIGRTLAAEVAYRRAVVADPSDAMPRYMMADLMARSGRHYEAMEQYRFALQLDPNGPVSEYCRRALFTYSTGTADRSQGGRGPGMDLLGSRLRCNDSPVPASPMGDALDTIDRQAQCAKDRVNGFALRLGNTAVKGGDWKARDIKDTAEWHIHAMYSSGMKSGLGDPPMSQSQMDEEARNIRKAAAEHARLEQEMARDRAAAHHQWSRTRQQDLRDTASNLKDQLHGRKKSPYGLDLDPVGTGLYVRNYKATPDKKVLPDARFSVVRLLDRGGLQEEDPAPGQ